jgi:hypothetical protein
MVTLSRRALMIGTPLALTAAAVGPILTAPTAQAVTYWQDGQNYGRWQCVYNGYGKVWGTDSRVQMAPLASTSLNETHACLVRSRATYSNVVYTATITTTRQLRTGAPANAWECGWLLWHHQADDKFYFHPQAQRLGTRKGDPRLG